MARLAGVAAAALLAACGGPDAVATRPEPPRTPPVDSSAAATLQVPDTIRFGGRYQEIVPDVRLLDRRGRPLDPALVEWRSEQDSVIGVYRPAGYSARLVSRQPGATRVIATVTRADGSALADTTWAVWAPVLERLWITTTQFALFPGQTADVGAVLIDTSKAMLPIPDSLGARAVWSSDHPEVARVDARGHVTAVARGNAVITLTIPPLGFRDSTLVGVTRVADLPFTAWRSDWRCAGRNCLLAAPDGGTLYTHAQDYRDGVVEAFTGRGEPLWSQRSTRTTPLRAVARDGTLYLASDALHAIGRDGTERWTAPCTGPVALGRDDEVYCADSTAILALSPAGALRWRLGRPNVRTLAATLDGRLYAVSHVFASPPALAASARIAAISADGRLLWERAPNDAVLSLAVDADGVLYVSYYGYRTEAIAPDGTTRWTIPGVRGELAIGPDRTLVMAREYGLVSAFRLADGSERWSTRDFTIGHGAPFVSSAGRVYVATDCWVHTLDARTGEVLGRTAEEHCTGDQPYLLVPGRLYLGRSYYTLPAPGEGPGSEWPQPGGDAGHSWRPQRN